VKQDVARVFNTGYFSACVPDAVDTRDGVKLIIKVRPPPALTSQLPTGVDLTLSESSMQQCGGRAEARAEGVVQAAGALLHVAPQDNGQPLMLMLVLEHHCVHLEHRSVYATREASLVLLMPDVLPHAL